MTSRHGSGTGGRRVAPWIIVTIIAAVVFAGAVTAFLVITQDDEDQAACSSQVVLQVVVAPAAAPSIEAAAAAFDATAPVARSACVTTDVTTVPGPDAATALAGGWVGEPSQPPALWFPDSATDLATLESTDSAMTAGRNPDPMATSPVVLAMGSADAAAVSAANLQWLDLPTAAGATGTVTLPNGGRLILALPDPTTNRATSDALLSVVAGLTGAPVDPAASGPVFAADFAQVQGQHQGLATVTVGGSTAGDQIFGVPITASWVDPTMNAAASAFLAYLRGSAGTQAFTDHGLQVGASSGVTLADAGPAVASALATAIGSPSATAAPGTTTPATTPAPPGGPDPSGGQPSAAVTTTPSG